MPKRSDRISRIKRLADIKSTILLQSFAKANSDVNTVMEQIEKLDDYQQEYRKLHHQRLEQGITGSENKQYQIFLQQLEVAITKQNQQLSLCKEKRDEAKTLWQQADNRSKVLERVEEKYLEEEQIARDKLEAMIVEDIVNARHSKK